MTINQKEAERMANEDMKVIAVMSRKGGAGKTALTRALISAMISNGGNCIAVDADDQKALSRWHDRITIKNDHLSVVGIDDPKELGSIIEDAYENETADYIIVDTMGSAGSWARPIAVHCDHIVLPIMLSETDLEIATDTFNWYQGLKAKAVDPSSLPKLSVVLSRVDKNPSKAMLAVARKATKAFPLVPDLFMERKQHADADLEGLLHDLAEDRRNNVNKLMRGHARYFDEAVGEAKKILKAILEAK